MARVNICERQQQQRRLYGIPSMPLTRLLPGDLTGFDSNISK